MRIQRRRTIEALLRAQRYAAVEARPALLARARVGVRAVAVVGALAVVDVHVACPRRRRRRAVGVALVHAVATQQRQRHKRVRVHRRDGLRAHRQRAVVALPPRRALALRQTREADADADANTSQTAACARRSTRRRATNTQRQPSVIAPRARTRQPHQQHKTAEEITCTTAAARLAKRRKRFAHSLHTNNAGRHTRQVRDSQCRGPHTSRC
jgi:hypothetical protein